MDRGANLEFDCLGYRDPVSMVMEERLLAYTLKLVEDGFEDRLLLSQDVCKVEHLQSFGGNGYTYVIGPFAERLRDNGVDEAVIKTMTIENPRRMLTISPTTRKD
jgi:phosphotriesterase-related protein